MRRSYRITALALTLTALASCSLSHHDDATKAITTAATTPSPEDVFASYSDDRAAADSTLDKSALGEIETGPLLEIDEAAYTAHRRLGTAPPLFEPAEPTTIWSAQAADGRSSFVAAAPLPQQHEQVVELFTRRSSADTWHVQAAPRLAEETNLPAVARNADGSVVQLVDGSTAVWSDGTPYRLGRAPQKIANHYAAVLTSKTSRHAVEFVKDSFISQMRMLRKSQPTKHVQFEQRWTAKPVHYVVRMADGGALMFVTLKRVDTFTVAPKSTLQFQGTDAAAYLPGSIRHKATLRYRHQVLMEIPNSGQPLVIGQYGGLVSASGH